MMLICSELVKLLSTLLALLEKVTIQAHIYGVPERGFWGLGEFLLQRRDEAAPAQAPLVRGLSLMTDSKNPGFRRGLF